VAILQAPQFLLSKASQIVLLQPALFFASPVIVIISQFPTGYKPNFWD